MTSPKSSVDKHSARYDFKRSFVRLIAPGIVSLLFSIIYFIAIPVATISSAGTYSLSLRAENIASIRKQLACALFGSTTSNFVFYGVYAVIIGVLFAFCIFFPIMRKSNVNFFFSCGIDRKTYFKNRALSSIIIMILTSAVPLMIDIIINSKIFRPCRFYYSSGIFPVFRAFYVYACRIFAYEYCNDGLLYCDRKPFLWRRSYLVTNALHCFDRMAFPEFP